MVLKVAFVLVLTVVAANSSKTPGPAWNDLRVRYTGQGQGNGFFQLPRTAREALAQGYTSPPEEWGVPTHVRIMCPANDPTICVLLDGAGNIAGLEIGVLKSDVLKTNYPFKQHPVFVSRKRFGYDTFITTLYFVEENILKRGGRPNISAHGTGTGLWIKNGPGGKKLFKVPRFEKDIGTTLFKRENCWLAMGRHYYYNMSPALRCEDFEPIFGLYRKGELIGFGYNVFGRATPVKKVWFEAIPYSIRKKVILDGPQCLSDRVAAFGIITLHVYFIDKPWEMTCDKYT